MLGVIGFIPPSALPFIGTELTDRWYVSGRYKDQGMIPVAFPLMGDPDDVNAVMEFVWAVSDYWQIETDAARLNAAPLLLRPGARVRLEGWRMEHPDHPTYLDKALDPSIKARYGYHLN